MKKISLFNRSFVYSFSRLSFPLFKRKNFKIAFSMSLSLYFFKIHFSNITFSSKEQIFLNSSENSVITFYSKTDNKPLSSGLLLNKDGSFMTIINSLSIEGNKIDADLYYAKLFKSKRVYNIKISNIINEENLVFGYLIPLDNNYSDLEVSSKIKIINNKDIEIGNKCYLVNKDELNLNQIRTCRVTENNLESTNLNGLPKNDHFIINLKNNQNINYGAPLFNKEGHFFGIVMPINPKILKNNILVKNNENLQYLIDQFVNNKEIKRPYIGMSVKYEGNKNGLLVIKLNSEGPAKQAGIKLGDIIKEVNNQKIIDNNGFLSALGYKNKKKLELKILRGEKLIDIELFSE